jgi:hypothetical protein
MTALDLRRKTHPRDCHNYLDSNLFDRHDDNDANRILAMRESGVVSFVIAKSVKDEVDHPNTPPKAKAKASGMLFTFPVRPSADEDRKKERVYAILIGNAINTEKHKPDANHVLEAGIHHGYFITIDDRILKKRGQLEAACGVRIVTPTEWLAFFDKPTLSAVTEPYPRP